MQQKSIKKNMLMNTILSVSNFIFPIITYSYVARVLTPTGTGKVAFVDSILAYFLYIASLGVPAYGRRETAKVRDDKEKLSHLVQELFIINGSATIVAYILLFIIVLTIPKLHGYSALFLIMGGQIVLKLIGVEWLYEGIEEYSYITIRSLVFKAISVLLTFVLIHTEADVLWYGFVHVFTISASYICNFINVRKYVNFRKTQSYDLKRHIKPILILFSASIAVTVYAHFDVSMIGFISSEHEVGLYNAALKIKNIVLAISTAVTAVLVPRMAYYFERKETNRIVELLSKSIRVSLLVALPVAVYVLTFSENVLAFIGGVEYVTAANTLRVQMACVFALIATNLCGAQLLIPIGREKRYTQSVIVGLLINLVLNWIMIPKMGAFGAAVATLITEIWNVLWMGTGCSDYLKQIIPKVSFVKYLIPMCCAAVGAYFVEKYLTSLIIFWQLAVTAIVFFGIYYCLQIAIKEPLITENGTRIIRKVFKK